MLSVSLYAGTTTESADLPDVPLDFPPLRCVAIEEIEERSQELRSSYRVNDFVVQPAWRSLKTALELMLF